MKMYPKAMAKNLFNDYGLIALKQPIKRMFSFVHT
jgi:hypothetical protein